MPTPPEQLHSLFEEASRAGSRLYRLGLTPAPGASLSFLRDGRIYITKPDSDFHSLREEDFACVTPGGQPLNNIPCGGDVSLHLPLYRQRGDVGAVIHAHSLYSALWSHLEHHEKPNDALPPHTPHFRGQLGEIALIPAAEPDFIPQAYEKSLTGGVAYLLQRHGAIACGNTIAAARARLELLEEAARFAWVMGGNHSVYYL
jgi:L-fuculose-phosphate aldolase